MVVDTSVLVAILLRESDGPALEARIVDEPDPLLSAATFLEASMVLYSRLSYGGFEDLDDLVRESGIRCVAVDRTQATIARDAFARYGKGHSPASLNFGDCFAYALAKAHGRPLLFTGNDFSHTDVVAA